MDASALSALLWRERQLLDLLAFRLEEEQLVVAAARPHMLAPATAEVHEVLDQVRTCEAERTQAVSALAGEVGLAGAPPLKDLIGVVDEPWSSLLEDHRAALREAVQRVSSIAATTRRLLAGHLTATADALSLLGAGSTGYAAAGSSLAAASVPARGRLVRGSM